VGWIHFLEAYFSVTYVGMAVGVLYSIYAAYFSANSRTGSLLLKVKPPLSVVYECVVNAFRFGFYTLLGLVALGFIASIVLSLWAIVKEISI
jgi:hypothetical protein|tara:strand:+ start:14116 stop:14391 length:276 start_codon:yes stop_codon:yes gene_type:complete